MVSPLVHQAALLPGGVEPNAVVHACRDMRRAEREECRLDIRRNHDGAGVLGRALADRHLPQRGEVGEAAVADGGERCELRQVAVHPAGLRAEGQHLPAVRVAHVRHPGLRANLHALALEFLEVPAAIVADDANTIVPRRCDLVRLLTAAHTVQAIGVVFHRGEFLGHLLHLGADDDYISKGEADDQEAIAKPAVALDRAVLLLERELRGLRGVPKVAEQQ
mmetsp:Transcript_26470/g.76316  ORF Transcript_26470/g.76316 Transcript_26470/m.76316 type:complete len:221 (+) Transcript_26470:1186-1848(+)